MWTFTASGGERDACGPARAAGDSCRKGKGQPAKLYYIGHVLMDHRQGLAVDVEVTEPRRLCRARSGAARCSTGCPSGRGRARSRRIRPTTPADFVAGCRERGVTPHVACNTTARAARRSTRARRGTPLPASQRLRKRIEESFGWSKDGRPLRKMKVAGRLGSALWRHSPSAAMRCCVWLTCSPSRRSHQRSARARRNRRIRGLECMNPNPLTDKVTARDPRRPAL